MTRPPRSSASAGSMTASASHSSTKGPAATPIHLVDLGAPLGGEAEFARHRLTPDTRRDPRLASLSFEETREGIRVTRNYQYTRWFDGSTHLWIGRRKQIGRGEGSSGLRFDTIASGS